MNLSKVFIFLFVTIFIFFVISFIVYHLPKPASGWPSHNPDNVTKVKYKGFGITGDFGWLGYIPNKFEIPLFQVYRPLFLNKNEIRNIVITKHLGNGKGLCRFDDSYANGSTRAKGTGMVHFTVGMWSCHITKYDDVIFFDPFGREVSRIEKSNGTETLMNEVGQIIMTAQYVDSKCVTVSWWDEGGNLLYSGPPPAIIPVVVQPVSSDLKLPDSDTDSGEITVAE